jgi:nucleoside-diphosphate kinase
MLRMTPQQASDWCNMLPAEEATPEYEAHIQSDVFVAMELVGDDAAERWLQTIGPASPEQARQVNRRSIRGIFGQDDIRNAVHGSASGDVAGAEINFFFGKRWPTTALFNNCTLCIIRPHAVESVGGNIITRIIEEGFEISALMLMPVEKACVQEFMNVYKGVLPEYHEMVEQLCTGPAFVMEVRQQAAVDAFRKLVGPHDPEVAKHLRPDTLRAKFGIDRVRNAVHCTDLPEDGLLEVEYFFNILYNRDNP